MIKTGTIYGIDFDGTCVFHEFPKVGSDVPFAVAVLKKIVTHGGRLVLWTMRSNHSSTPISDDPDIHCVAGQYLDDAVNWFKERNIPLFGVQRNPDQDSWTNSPKAYCHTFIDDANLGCPLITPAFSRPYVDWVGVDRLLFPKSTVLRQ